MIQREKRPWARHRIKASDSESSRVVEVKPEVDRSRNEPELGESIPVSNSKNGGRSKRQRAKKKLAKQRENELNAVDQKRSPSTGGSRVESSGLSRWTTVGLDIPETPAGSVLAFSDNWKNPQRSRSDFGRYADAETDDGSPKNAFFGGLLGKEVESASQSSHQWGQNIRNEVCVNLIMISATAFAGRAVGNGLSTSDCRLISRSLGAGWPTRPRKMREFVTDLVVTICDEDKDTAQHSFSTLRLMLEREIIPEVEDASSIRVTSHDEAKVADK